MRSHEYEHFLTGVVYIVLELLIAALAILGNVLVCWAVCLNSNLQNVTNYFVASLATADIAVGLLAIPFAISISTGFCASFHGCLFIACFVLVLTQSSIFSLLAIAIDRIIAIRIPLRYNALVTGGRAKGIIAICWVLSFAIGLTPMLGWHKDEQESRDRSAHRNCTADMVACLFEYVVTMEYMVYYNFFACVLLPLLLMFGIYLKIFMAARRQLKQTGSKTAQGEPSRSTLQKEVHAAKPLAIIVGLFALCWLPMHTVNCYILLCQGCSRPPLWLMNLSIILSHANSVVNPVIYAYRIREFRCTFRKILGQHILGRKEGFKAASGGRRTSVHEEEAEEASMPAGAYAPHPCAGGQLEGSALNRGREDSHVGLEWPRNGEAGAANGHIACACKNGGLPQKKALLGVKASRADLEAPGLHRSDVS